MLDKNNTVVCKRAAGIAVLSLMLPALVLMLCNPLYLVADRDKILPKNYMKIYAEDYHRLLMMVEDSVKLPLNEYNRLLELIRKAEEKRKEEEERLKKLQQMSSARKYTVSSGKMTCTVQENSVDVELSLKADLLKEGWKEIPLARLPGLERMLLNSEKAPLTKISDDRYSLYTDKTGSAKISIVFHPTIERNTRSRRIYNKFRIEFNQRATTDIKITLPRGAEPTRECIKRYNFIRKKNLWLAKFSTDVTMPLEVVWFVPRKDVPVTEKKIEYSGNVLSFFIFDEKTIRSVSLIKVEMIGGLKRRLTLKLPDGYTPVDRELPGGITLDYDRNKNEIDLIIAPDFDESIQMILSLEKKIEAENHVIQPIWIEGARRQYGHIALKGEGLRLKLESAGSFEGIDTRLLPSELRGLAGTEAERGFKYTVTQTTPEPLRISFEPIKTAESLPAYIKSMKYTVVASREGIHFTEAEINAINNSKQFLEVKLPADSELQSSFVDGKPVKPVRREDKTVMIPIRPKKHSRDGLVQIGFVYRAESSEFLEDGEMRIELPVLNLPINDLRCRLYLPEKYEYEDFEGSFKKGEPVYMPPIKTLLKSWEEKPAEEKEEGRFALREDIKVKDVTADSWAGALPLRIKLPKTGIKYDFYDLLVTGEKPFIIFEYESE